ncbi:MAG: chaperone modulator CbpM [Desulforhabdus sp.]|nr:chaperone modulator CbpM [Desulforhabdus sp.]
MVEQRQYLMVRLKRSAGFSPYVSMSEVASRCGVHPDLIDRFIYLGLIDPIGREEDEFIFRSEVIPLVRKIIRLRNSLGINYAGIGLVLELLKRVEELERRIEQLRAEMK